MPRLARLDAPGLLHHIIICGIDISSRTNMPRFFSFSMNCRLPLFRHYEIEIILIVIH